MNISQFVSGTSLVIPASTFTSGQYYQANLQFYSNYVTNSNPNPIPAAGGGGVGYETQLYFIIQAGSPDSFQGQVYHTEKSTSWTQTSNSAPTGILGAFNYESPAPYSFSIQSSTPGTVTGPSASSYPLVFSATYDSSKGGDFIFESGPLSTQGSLDSTALNGSYTFPDSQVVSLTGSVYPNIPQVTLVNGATPTWDAQGRLVDPTIANTLTWTAFNTMSNPNWHEDFEFESDNGGQVDLTQKAGVSETSSTLFNTFVIPAGTMTTGSTYTGDLNYLLATTAVTTVSAIHAAGYVSETYFSVLAQPSTTSPITPSLFLQNGTSLGILTLKPNFLPSAWQGVGAMNSGWQQAAIGDITGNGVNDIIFQKWNVPLGP